MNEKTTTKKKEPIVESQVAPGHRACAGCGELLAARLVMNAAGKNVIATCATGCLEVVSSAYPQSAWKMPWIHSLFENPTAVASGIEAALKALGREDEANIIAQGGDGSTADIGIGCLSGMLERGHNVLYICYDNEAYMNTGNQRSGTTMPFAATTTTPIGQLKRGEQHIRGKLRKDMPAIMAAHGIPYIATASIAYPADLVKKVKKAASIHGPRYIHIHCPCATGWGFPESKTVEIARLAVQTGAWVLFEIEDGKLTVTQKLAKKKPVKDYLIGQKRFRHITDPEIAQIQELIDKKWSELGLA